MVKYSRKSKLVKRPRSTKKVYRKALPTKSLVKLIKKVSIKASEPKNNAISWGKFELYHNSGSPASGQILPGAIDLLHYSMIPVQGDGDHQRNGDQIVAKGTSVKMLLGQKANRMNITFRIVVWKGTDDAKPVSYNELFDQITSNVLLDTTNSDRGKIVYNKYIKRSFSPQLGSTTAEATFVHKFFIPYRKLIKFNYNNATSFSGEKLYAYVFAYDAYGTLLTDNIAYYQAFLRFYYRDP